MRRTFGLILFLVLLCAPAAVLGATSEELRMEQEYSKGKQLIRHAGNGYEKKESYESLARARKRSPGGAFIRDRYQST